MFVFYFCLVFLFCFNVLRIVVVDCRVNLNFFLIGVLVRFLVIFVFVFVLCLLILVNVLVLIKVLLILFKIKGLVDGELLILEFFFVIFFMRCWM